jgi:nucleolin
MMVCGKIAGIRLAVWNHTGKLKGFGYVEFQSETSAGIAVKKSGKITLDGRPLVCDFETGAPKLSYRTPEGVPWKKKEKARK